MTFNKIPLWQRGACMLSLLMVSMISFVFLTWTQKNMEVIGPYEWAIVTPLIFVAKLTAVGGLIGCIVIPIASAVFWDEREDDA